VVEIVRLRLEQDGHTILAAGDGRVGLQSAFENKPDLLILDVMMPGLDGFEVAYQMKNNPLTANTPIVMLTARADFGSIAKGWNLDVDNYVTKPFKLDELADTVKSVLIYRGKLQAD
jgi:two-component system, OmpR family, alkaline phosphatase synthesis response regulator PhoP